MKLKLHEIIDVPGGESPFDYDVFLTDLEVNYAKPFVHPIRVAGRVRNNAGVLNLTAQCSTSIQYHCDRCTRETETDFRFTIDVVLAEKLENPEDFDNAEIVLLEDATVDVDEIVRSAVILECEMTFLCEEDCKGICPRCGKNLNDGPCGCGSDTDPRLDKLKQWLDRK